MYWISTPCCPFGKIGYNRRECSKSNGSGNECKMEQKEIKLWDTVPGYDLNEEVDLDEMHSWFLDGTHCVPPLDPLFCWFGTKAWGHGIAILGNLVLYCNIVNDK